MDEDDRDNNVCRVCGVNRQRHTIYYKSINCVGLLKNACE